MITDPAKIHAILFDWGGVCCSGADPFAYAALQEALGMNPNQITAHVDHLYNEYAIGKLTRDEFWRSVLAYFKLKENDALNPEKFSRAYRASYTLYPEVLALAQALRTHYKIGLLSNLLPEMRDHVRREHHTADFFDFEIYSCDEGVCAMKPDQLSFDLALKKFGVAPEECLFIDDSKKNIAAAAALGFQTYLFEGPEKFLQDMGQAFSC